MNLIVVGLVMGAAILTWPAAARAETAHCQDNPVHNRWAGNIRNVGSWSAYGARATVNPAGATFRACDGSGGPFSIDGPAAWVAVIGTSGDGNQIIQIGIINCNAPLVGTCDGDNVSHYFYADGGCFNLPTGEDLGVANMDPHQYSLARITTPSGPRWNFYIDNVLKRYLYESDGAIDCWITGDRAAEWSGETWDGGDGYADPGDKLNFTYSAYKSSYTGAWLNPLWDSSNLCDPGADNSVSLDHKCDLVGTDKFDIWSVGF